MMYRFCILVYVNQLMKSTGNMDLFLLMFRAPPILPKPLLSSMEKAIRPAEPANGTGFSKGPPLVSQTLLMQRHKTNRLISRALLLLYSVLERITNRPNFCFLKHKFPVIVVVPPSLLSNTDPFAALVQDGERQFCLMLLNICALIQQCLTHPGYSSSKIDLITA